MTGRRAGGPRTLRERERDGVVWLEAELPGARAAFSCRLGGVSAPPYDELNLGLLTGDSRAAVRENRTRLAGALGLAPQRIAIGRQVHGARIAEHRGPQQPSPFATPGTNPPEVDGHLLADPGAEPELALLVLVADCMPIALAGPGGIAILHGGWRGLVAGIVASGCEATGATDAVIGPGIGPCCYEVGEEVLEAFAPLGLEGISEGRMLDLPAAARALLERQGVERIEVVGQCTMCRPERYYSHRGQGPMTGRQAGLVWGVG